MNTIKYHYSKGLFLSFLALGASALMSSCSNEDIPAAAGGSLADDRVAVEVQGKVAGIEAAGTRVDQDINTNSFYSSSYQNATIKINNGGTTSYSSYTYSVNANGLDAGSNKHYFPSEVNSVSVYGWYPATSNNGTSFSIEADQSSAENYVKSDLMLANATNCTRELDNNAWSVTPAALTFRHVMARMKVSITAASDITISNVVLKGVRKSVTITESTPSGLSVSLDPDNTSTSDITLYSGTKSGKGENTALDFYGVIPGASYSSSNAFLVVTAKNAKGTNVEVTFKTSDNVTLTSGNVYNLNLALGQIHGNVTYTVSNWSATTGNATVSAGEFEDPAAISTTASITDNPLYYVAQYNLKTIKGVVDPATKTASNESGTAASATAFNTSGSADYLSAMGNVFKFSEAQGTVKGGSAAMENYHLPNEAEQLAIIPNTTVGAYQLNIFNKTGLFTVSEVASGIGYTDASTCTTTLATHTSYWLKNADNDYYAVRFVGDNSHASAWHYKFVAGSGLTIQSYILKTDPTDATSAKKILNALPYTNVWEGAKNERPEANAPATNAVVQRFLPSCGYEISDGQTGKATTTVGTHGYYWSATEGSNADNGMGWRFGNGNLNEGSVDKRYGFSVRLFHD